MIAWKSYSTLNKVEQDVANVIPDNEFQGIGVIDWEYWRPVFDRNWDKLSIYRSVRILFCLEIVLNTLIVEPLYWVFPKKSKSRQLLLMEQRS